MLDVARLMPASFHKITIAKNMQLICGPVARATLRAQAGRVA
jgi:hypothetical protein